MPQSTLFPYTTLFRSSMIIHMTPWHRSDYARLPDEDGVMKALRTFKLPPNDYMVPHPGSGEYMKSKEYDGKRDAGPVMVVTRSEEHTSELQSLRHLVCRNPHSFPTRRSSDLR